MTASPESHNASVQEPLLALSELLASHVPYGGSGRKLHGEVVTFLAGLMRHARLGAEGPLVVQVFGGANTGKSSLFNALAGRDLSIAHAIAGSTRHIVACADEPTCRVLEDPALWPAPYRPERLARRESVV